MHTIEGSERLSVCGKCGRLFGPFRDRRTSVARRQRCCRHSDARPWPGYDYNTAFELCWCCAAVVIPSGSRWSLIFCPDCHAKVLQIRDGWPARGTEIPIGRHSLMNGLAGLRPKSLLGMGCALDRTCAWRRARVERVFSALRGDRATLAAYLALAARLFGADDPTTALAEDFSSAGA